MIKKVLLTVLMVVIATGGLYADEKDKSNIGIITQEHNMRLGNNRIRAYPGMEAEIIEEKDNRYKILMNNKIGYVDKYHLVVLNDEIADIKLFTKGMDFINYAKIQPKS